jgi:hypothetical protein
MPHTCSIRVDERGSVSERIPSINFDPLAGGPFLENSVLFGEGSIPDVTLSTVSLYPRRKPFGTVVVACHGAIGDDGSLDAGSTTRGPRSH